MFKSTLIATTVALMASVCVSQAGAADDVMFSTGGYARGGEGLRTMKVMKAMDKDSDKMVSKDEFIEMHEATFDKMDKDHDGMISAEEWGGKQRKADSRSTRKEGAAGRAGAASKEGAASTERAATKRDEAPNKKDREGTLDDSVPGNRDLPGPTR